MKGRLGVALEYREQGSCLPPVGVTSLAAPGSLGVLAGLVDGLVWLYRESANKMSLIEGSWVYAWECTHSVCPMHFAV